MEYEVEYESAEAVYFVQAVDGGPIKIGRSWNPAVRLADLQRMQPYELVLRAVIPNGGPSLEAQLHQRFHDARIRGEWFKPVPELVALCSAVEHGQPLPPEPSPAPIYGEHEEFRREVARALVEHSAYGHCNRTLYRRICQLVGVRRMDGLAQYARSGTL